MNISLSYFILQVSSVFYTEFQRSVETLKSLAACSIKKILLLHLIKVLNTKCTNTRQLLFTSPTSIKMETYN